MSHGIEEMAWNLLNTPKITRDVCGRDRLLAILRRVHLDFASLALPEAHLLQLISFGCSTRFASSSFFAFVSKAARLMGLHNCRLGPASQLTETFGR